MTCEEFERVLPELEGGHTIEQEEHLRTCPGCAELVEDLQAIQRRARELQASETPSPRVWNSIEFALRQEGLIRQPHPVSATPSGLWPRWRLAWLVAMAALLVGLGMRVTQQGIRQSQMAVKQPVVSPAISVGQQPEQAAIFADDEEVLKLVASRAPALQAAFASDLRAVNAYIRDAEQSARNNPDDEIAQQYLVSAYQQRAMVYEMALDRSMP